MVLSSFCVSSPSFVCLSFVFSLNSPSFPSAFRFSCYLLLSLSITSYKSFSRPLFIFSFSNVYYFYFPQSLFYKVLITKSLLCHISFLNYDLFFFLLSNNISLLFQLCLTISYYISLFVFLSFFTIPLLLRWCRCLCPLCPSNHSCLDPPLHQSP